MKSLTWYLKIAGTLVASILAIVPESATARFNSVDPLQQKYPAWSPYCYALANPIRNLDLNGAEAFSVTVRAWIPWHRLGPFVGDADGKSSRISQTVQVETDPNVSENPITGATTETGVTVLSVPGVVLGIGQASTDAIDASGTRTSANGGDNAVITLTGSAANPLMPGSPSIDYKWRLTLVPGQNPVVTGNHDGFPAHSVTVSDKSGNPIGSYRYAPSSKLDLYKLSGSGNVVVPPKKLQKEPEPDKGKVLKPPDDLIVWPHKPE